MTVNRISPPSRPAVEAAPRYSGGPLRLASGDQDPATAGTTRLPESVIVAGAADRGLPVEEMPALLHQLVREGRTALGQADGSVHRVWCGDA